MIRVPTTLSLSSGEIYFYGVTVKILFAVSCQFFSVFGLGVRWGGGRV